LLLYYGVLALTRALVLFAIPGFRETALSQGHGVGILGWSNVLSDADGVSRLDALTLQVQSGTFCELARATGNTEWVQAGWGNEFNEIVSRVVPVDGYWGWLAPGSQTLPKLARFSLGDVLSRIPDLAFLYGETMGTSAVCHPVRSTVLRGPFNMGPGIPPKVQRISLVLNRTGPDLGDLGSLAKSLGIPEDRISIRTQDQIHAVLEVAADSTDDVIAFLSTSRVNNRGEDFLAPQLPGGLNLSTLSLAFLAAYALGMLARYYPTSWQGLTAMRRGDRVTPLLRATTSYVEQRVPIEVADFLERPTLSVGEIHELPHLRL
jgi:hypothetical protein